MTAILNDHLFRFSSARGVAGDDAEAFLDALIAEEDEIVLASVFRAWRDKGIDADEIYAIAKIMRDRCVRVSSVHRTFVDIVGTGGSRTKTFNVSTAASFIAAGCGIAVAKHGNRAATSSTGSADVLESLRIEPAVDAATAEKCLKEIGICFMFAPNFHRLSPTLGKVRRGLGFPTIFNCVGPLCNPAGAPHQLIGVWEEPMVHKIAEALVRLGTARSWVVHGRDGLDEISMYERTVVAEVCGDQVRQFEISPEEAGITLPTPKRVTARSAAESAEIIRSVLSPDAPPSAARDIAALNAAAAIVAAGQEPAISKAFERAVESIESGKALKKLNELSRLSKQ